MESFYPWIADGESPRLGAGRGGSRLLARWRSLAIGIAVLSGCIAATALAGCGGASGGPATPARFPQAKGQTLDRLRAGHRGQELVLAPSGVIVDRGSNRFAFALFDASHKLITASAVALYTADASGRAVAGPYLAHLESLAVARPFQSRTVAQDPDAAKAVYVAEIPFTTKGSHLITALVRVGDHVLRTTEDQLDVAPAGAQPPRVGQRAISVHTPTVAQARGNLASIDTRLPPAPDLQRVDFARVLGRRPVVLMFATPGLCQSRVCGPVVDIEEQVKSEIGGRVTFIHMEIYENNNPAAGLRPQVSAWHLATEPWTFVIDKTGRVAARFEGALSAAELRQAVRGVLAGAG